MTKTIFTVTPHDESRIEKEIFKMVRNHNAGKVTIDLELIMAYIKGEWAQWIPSKETTLRHSIPDKVLEVWEGETHVLTIVAKEVHKLESDPDDLKDTLNGMGETDREVETQLNRNK